MKDRFDIDCIPNVGDILRITTLKDRHNYDSERYDVIRREIVVEKTWDKRCISHAILTVKKKID